MLKAEANRIGFLEEGRTFRYEYFTARREHRVYLPPFLQKMKLISRERVWLNRKPHTELGRD